MRKANVQPTLIAKLDDRAVAILDELTPLRYSAAPSASEDVPAHVRSASALRRARGRLVIVQDDVNVLAVRDEDGEICAVLLPLGPGGRRTFDDGGSNKQDKMDLEACATLPDGRLVAFGSGSSPARETLVEWRAGQPPRRIPAPALYEALRNETAFSGSELNVEGAVVQGQRLLLFQRGNGAATNEFTPVNAIGTLSLREFYAWLGDDGAEVPRLKTVTPVGLGAIDGVGLGFTDASVTANGRIAVLACAEDSRGAVCDGPVLGCRVGVLDGRELRMVDIVDVLGAPVTLKLEGIESRPGRELEFDVVADVDRPLVPARLARLRIRER